MDTQCAKFLKRQDFQQLLVKLQAAGYRVVGPQVRDEALIYADLTSVNQLPKGWTDYQVPGAYRLQQTGSERLFNWANGPQALKPLLFPAREVLWQARRQADGSVEFLIPDAQVEKVAVLGVKACDLAALRLQDQHFLEGEFVDPGYQARRAGLLLLGVNCSHASETCFCHSTGDGPEVSTGADILLSELDEGFLIQADTPAGQSIMQQLPLQTVSTDQIARSEQQTAQAVQQQVRELPAIKPDQLQSARAHPQWDDVADRCLACGNCTMVCPTCFCHHQTDLLSLSGEHSDRQREWDSCFGESHGHLAGMQVRPDVKTRYQQWMIHKLDVWQNQYGRSGCVGCGRCTSWCPAEIDFVAEVRALTGESS
ncbi:4Fe-4S dicluster domain-containing protein [Pontibacter sp. JAM-7]|uniref:4Fe-4S dicluster domain-containing protein n=1 Tax=Pontibacter sp. JAM-7 TaxID=3366581 RepID=UPI003AF60A23